MTDEQGLALARLSREHPSLHIHVATQPYGLRTDCIEVAFARAVPPPVAWIAPDGEVEMPPPFPVPTRTESP